MDLVRALAGMVRIAIAGIVIVSTPAHSTPFLEIDDIDGESTVKGHEGWIDLLSVSWGVHATAPSDPKGGPGGRTPPQFDDLRWTQYADKSTPQLFAAISMGEPIRSATVDFTEAFQDGAPRTYFQMTFTDVFLTALDLEAAGPERPMVSGAFAYRVVAMTYTEYDETGAKKGSISATYDLESGKGSAAALAGVFALGASGPGTPIPEPAPAPAVLVALGLLGRHLQRQRERTRTA